MFLPSDQIMRRAESLSLSNFETDPASMDEGPSLRPLLSRITEFSSRVRARQGRTSEFFVEKVDDSSRGTHRLRPLARCWVVRQNYVDALASEPSSRSIISCDRPRGRLLM